MADHPLRPATHRSLGGPLPHQQANGPRARLSPKAEAIFGTAPCSTALYPALIRVSPGYSRCKRLITHVLLTRSPLEYFPKEAFPLDLHVLSTPPAFVLSQDQTLRESLLQRRRRSGATSAPSIAEGRLGELVSLRPTAGIAPEEARRSLIRRCPRPRADPRRGRSEPAAIARQDGWRLGDPHTVEFSKTRRLAADHLASSFSPVTAKFGVISASSAHQKGSSAPPEAPDTVPLRAGQRVGTSKLRRVSVR